MWLFQRRPRRLQPSSLLLVVLPLAMLLLHPDTLCASAASHSKNSTKSVANDKIYQVPLFTGEKFQEWASRMVFYLVSSDLYDVVGISPSTLAPLPQPPTLSSENDRQRDKKAKERILIRLSDDLIILDQTALTSYDLWSLLHRTYARTTMASVVPKLKALVTTSRSSSQTITDYIASMKTKALALRNAGIKLDDTFIVALILANLPDEYQAVVAAMDDVIEEASIEKVTIMLLNAEASKSQSVAANYVHQSLEVVDQEPEEQTSVQPISSFDDMDLRQDLLRDIYDYGFKKPSAIQQQCIVPMVRGRDLIVEAQSGTGQIATFSISMLQRIDRNVKETQVLILVHSRQVAQQIRKLLDALGDHQEVTSRACVDATFAENDVRILRGGVQIVVGTPECVFDLITFGALSLKHVKSFILDQADEMFSSGFKKQIYGMFQSLPNKGHISLFSATMPEEILAFTGKFMRDPIRILVKPDELTLEDTRQFYINVEPKWQSKFDALCELLDKFPNSQVTIYSNSFRALKRCLRRHMHQLDSTILAMHEYTEPHKRERIMKEFRSGSSRVLVTTDMLAHGIDIQQASLVINFDLPPTRENLLRRIKRSGRFGGVVINLVTDDDIRSMQEVEQIEKFYNTQVEKMPMNTVDLI